MPRAGRRAAVLALVAVMSAAVVSAQHDHMALYSTEPDGGALTLEWDFEHKKVQTFPTHCENGSCLYTTINPAILAPDLDESPAGPYHLRDGTRVSIEIIAIDEAAQLVVNGNRLDAPGKTARLGTTPDDLHTHPNWQLMVPEDEHGDYEISYVLRADAGYAASQTYTSVMTNIAPAENTVTPTPRATATPVPNACVGDCDGNGVVAVDELISGVNVALGELPVGVCLDFDADHDCRISVDELVRGVAGAMNGCVAGPTPTPGAPATLATVQAEIFDATCAVSFCHNSLSRAGGLDLSPGIAYSELVNVESANASAALQGLQRVAPGAPDASFLVVKVLGPPPDQGNLMPLVGPPLSAEQVQLLRAWIAACAPP